MRVVDVPDVVNAMVGSFVGMQYRDGTTSYTMRFGSEADGNPIVELVDNMGDASFTLQGGGGGYHLYELAFDPTTGSADLLVDGAEVLSDWLKRRLVVSRRAELGCASGGFEGSQGAQRCAA